MQRAVHGDLDLRLPLVVELDLIDLANGLAANQDLVVVDELAAGLEQQPVVIARPAAREEQEDDRDGDQRESGECRQPRDPTSPSDARDLRRDGLFPGRHRPRLGAVAAALELRASVPVPMTVPSSSSSLLLPAVPSPAASYD